MYGLKTADKLSHSPSTVRRGLWHWAITATFALTLTVGGESSSAAGLEGNEDPIHVETFDAVWKIISDTHYDPDALGEEWDDAYAELRPAAEAAESTAELREVINELLSRLGESHFVLLPREAVEGDVPSLDAPDASEADRDAAPPPEQPRTLRDRADVGLNVRVLDDEVIVTSIESGGAAADADVQVGWSIVDITPGPDREQREADEPDPPADPAEAETRGPQRWTLQERIALLRDSLPESELDRQVISFVQEQLGGPVGSRVTVTFRTDESVRDVELTRRRPEGQTVQFGNLPPVTVHFHARNLHIPDAPDLHVGLIDFNIWLLPVMRQFDEAIDDFRSADGIILDLRGNPGGIGGMSMGIAGHFFDKPASLGTFRNRTAELEFRANPRFSSPTGEPVEPYDGPVAILIDRMTGSTSEIFAGGMQALGRARVFGETSMGAALPSTTTPLPNHDVLQHAIADFVSADGKRLEGRGVVPDEEITIGRDDLLAGQDPILEAAINWIADPVEKREKMDEPETREDEEQREDGRGDSPPDSVDEDAPPSTR